MYGLNVKSSRYDRAIPNYNPIRPVSETIKQG
jgi:hypothetical protein